MQPLKWRVNKASKPYGIDFAACSYREDFKMTLKHNNLPMQPS